MNKLNIASFLLLLTTVLHISLLAGIASGRESLPVQVFKKLKSGKPQTVVTYGTSLTHTAEWPNALHEYFDQRYPGLVEFKNCASSGKQSNWGVANLDKRVLSRNPDLVFIEFSMNDAATKHDISTETALNNIDKMVRALRQQNPQIDIVLMTMNTVWNSPLEPKDGGSATARPRLNDYYDGYRTYARENDLPLIDHTANWMQLQQTDKDKFRKWVPDGTHPIPEASLAVTWPAIQSLLERARGVAEEESIDSEALPQQAMDSIVSGVPWYDNRDEPVSAHGAGVLKVGDSYYLFGEFKRDGGNAFSGVSCYSSRDLYNWRFERVVLPVQDSGRLGPNRVGERPKVMKCPQTGKYVMYLHTDDSNYKDPAVGYATCDTVDGVYAFQGALKMNGSSVRKWDMGVFQDDDGTGYLITHSGNLYRLSDDYTSVAEVVVEKMTPHCESPAIFKRDGVYYWLGSNLTSWERNDNYYFTATSLEGPWTERGLFAPKGTLTWNSQTTFVLPVAGSEQTTYIYMGDRWAHPYQRSAATYVWQPLSFKGDSLSLTHYHQSWKIDTNTGISKPNVFEGERIQASEVNRIRYSEGWENAPAEESFSDYRSNVKGASFSFDFEGTQVGLISVARPDGGFARVELFDRNGKAIVTNVIENYCAYPESSLKFLSPILKRGSYKVQVTVLGEHFFWQAKTKQWGSEGDFVSLESIIVTE